MTPRYPDRVRLTAGTVLAERYRLTALLGQGGMGEVWAARHVLTGKAVAVKWLVCPADERGHGEARARFALEARSACAVEHPNVVEIFDFIEDDARAPFIVMELLRGETLAARLARGPLGSAREVASLLLPVVSAVGAAHERGIVHRDLKPSNIFVDARPGDGRALVKVLDFGIAKWLAGSGEGGLRTRTGSTLGTPSYMAPEQATGDRSADHRVDIWSLGVILYEALSGVRPLEGDNAAQLVMRLLSTGIMPIEQLVPELPGELAALIGRMLSRDVTRRPADLREVHRMLSALSGEASRAFGAPHPPEHAPGLAPPPPMLALAEGRAPQAGALGLLETHTAIEMNTESLGEGPVPGRARRVRRPLLVALLGAALLASGAAWVVRGGALASHEPLAARDALAPQATTSVATDASGPAAARTSAPPSHAPAAEDHAADISSTPHRVPAPATSVPAPRTPVVRRAATDTKHPRPAALRSTPRAPAPRLTATNATPRPERRTTSGAPGAECESSAECASRLCVAYACQ